MGQKIVSHLADTDIKSVQLKLTFFDSKEPVFTISSYDLTKAYFGGAVLPKSFTAWVLAVQEHILGETFIEKDDN